MSDLITETPEACSWIAREKARRIGDSAFGSFQAGVIWVDEPCPDGEIIGGTDPSTMIDQINNEGWPLYRGHDPGFPSGRSIAAKLFVSPSGRKFVVAILGFYVDKLRRSFDDLGVDSNPEASSPLMLDALFNGSFILQLTREKLTRNGLKMFFAMLLYQLCSRNCHTTLKIGNMS